MKAALRLSVNVSMKVHDALTDEVLRTEQGHNLVVLVGRNLVRDLIAATFNAAPIGGPTHFALGTDGTAVNDADTALGTEVLRDDLTQITTAASVVACKYFLSSVTLNGTTIREIGLFNAAAGPIMLARYVLDTPIVKDATIAVTFQWAITLSAP